MGRPCETGVSERGESATHDSPRGVMDYGQLPEWALLEPDDPVDGVVVDGVVVVDVDEVVDEEPAAALAIAAPPPPMTPAIPSVTRAIRNRDTFTSFWLSGLSERAVVNTGMNGSCADAVRTSVDGDS